MLDKRNEAQSIKSSVLLLVGFSTVFFSRLLDSAGAPSTINFLHLILIPIIVLIVLFKTRIKNLKQIKSVQLLLLSLAIFGTSVLASALFNNSGLINCLFSFLLWVEGYIFLCGIISLPLSNHICEKLKTWLFRFSIFHIGLALTQKLLLDVGIMKPGELGIPEDNIQGVFYVSGGGHVVAASVSISFAIYYFSESKNAPTYIKWLVLIASMMQLVFADAKQVLLVVFVSWVLLILTKIGDIGKLVTYSAAIGVSVAALLWCMENVPAFRSFNTWVRPEIYGPEGEATLLKSSSIRIILSHYENGFNWLFGIGPGHTVDRLGGWMLPKYESLLAPLGATIHPVSNEVWDAVWASWLGKASSMFSPLFGWAGLWGDLGILGLVAYFLILLVIWSNICVDDMSKFMLLTVCVNGLIFSQMQEPGFLIYICLLIGVRWHDRKTSLLMTYSRPYVESQYAMVEAEYSDRL